jgi:hypothetical protein
MGDGATGVVLFGQDGDGGGDCSRFIGASTSIRVPRVNSVLSLRLNFIVMTNISLTFNDEFLVQVHVICSTHTCKEVET